MPNSTIQLQAVVDAARSFPEIFPVLSAGGMSAQPALQIATDTMRALLDGWQDPMPPNRQVGPFPWKFNRFNIAPFPFNGWQGDYATISLKNLGWIEHCWIVDVNNTAIPKPKYKVEANRDLETTSEQYGRPGNICWLPNDQLLYGVWGGAIQTVQGPQNPGPGVTYTNPLGVTSVPANPIMQVIDTNGNLQLLTTFGTTGGVQPSWPAAGAVAGTTTADGSCVWTVCDPKAQGFRINPIPPQASTVFQINPVGQMKAVAFTSLAQTLEPIPDDFEPYFRRGFIAQCYQHAVQAGLRAKFVDQMRLWMQALERATKTSDREVEEYSFYPDRNVMGDPAGIPDPGAAWPFPLPSA